MNFTNIRSTYLEIHPIQREAIHGLVDKVERGRRAKWRVEALIAFIGNCMTIAGKDPVYINAKVIKKHFGGISISSLVNAKLIKRVDGYSPGKHAYAYRMTDTMADVWYPAWKKAITRPLSESVTLDGPSPTLKPETAIPARTPLSSDHFRNLLDRDVDVPLKKSLAFLDNPIVIQAVEYYIDKLNNIVHPVNVPHLERTRDFGLDLMRDNPRCSEKWYKGQSYVTATRLILRRTVNGGYYPEMNWSEGRVFDSGIQLLSKHFDKDKILGPDQANYDMKAAHVVFTKKIMEDQGMDTSFLEGYIENKEEMAQTLGLNVDVFKIAFLGILNGASLEIDNRGENTIYKAFYEAYGPLFISKMKSFVIPFLNLHKDTKEISRQAEIMGATRRQETNVGFIATILEFVAKALIVMENELEILGDQHDGILVGTKSKEKFLKTTFVKDYMDIQLTMVNKPLGDDRDIYPSKQATIEILKDNEDTIKQATIEILKDNEDTSKQATIEILKDNEDQRNYSTKELLVDNVEQRNYSTKMLPGEASRDLARSAKGEASLPLWCHIEAIGLTVLPVGVETNYTGDDS